MAITQAKQQAGLTLFINDHKLREVSRVLKIPFSSLQRLADEQKWNDKKIEYQKRLSAKIEEQLPELGMEKLREYIRGFLGLMFAKFKEAPVGNAEDLAREINKTFEIIVAMHNNELIQLVKEEMHNVPIQ